MKNKNNGFSKLYSVLLGTPIYVFPEFSIPKDAEFKEYMKKGIMFGHYSNCPMYSPITLGVYMQNILGYIVPLEGVGFCIYTDSLFEKLSAHAKNYVLLHEEAHAITGRMQEDKGQTHVEFECWIDTQTGLTKDTIISSIEEIIDLLKKESKFIFRSQIKFFKEKLKYYKSH